MTEQEAFEAALAKDRYDCTTRLVYADWLEERGLDDQAAEQRRMATPEWVEADRWMHEFVKTLGSSCINYDAVWDKHEPEEWHDFTYDEVIQAGHDALRDGDYLVQLGSNEARDHMYNPLTKEKFWDCWSTITGIPVSEEDREHSVFSCSC